MKNFRQWCLENSKFDLLKTYENAQNEYASDKIGFSGLNKVNWKCTKCGMEWVLNTNKMHKRKEICLYCSHKKASPFYNLETEEPSLAKEFNLKKNSKKPTQYIPTSHKKIWWKCEKGHEFEQTIRQRVKSAKINLINGRPICPFCNHERVSSTYNLFKEFRYIAKQWNYKMNGSLTPLQVSPKSSKKVWWTCEFDSTHIWQSKISNRTVLNRGCPICAKNSKSSFQERALYFYLKEFFNDCEIGKGILGQYILDILIPSYKIIIEYDGWFYHDNKESKKREEKRDKLLNDFDIIRIKEVKEEINEIIYDKNMIKYHPQENYKNLDKVIWC